MLKTTTLRLLSLATCLAAVGTLVGACGNDDGGDDDGTTPCPIEANYDSIHDNLLASQRCAGAFCHDNGTASGSLDFSLGKAMVHTAIVGAASTNVSATKPTRIVSGNAADSWFYVKVAEAMPPGGRMPVGGALMQCEIDAIGAWIDAGAAQ